MKFRNLIFILIFAIFSFLLFADDKSSESDPYLEITSQEDWFLGRGIEKYSIAGVSQAHIREVTGVLNRFLGKKFSYELLTDLQSGLYNLGYFESIEPKVDITPSYKLYLIFEFKEMPYINNISFTSQDKNRELNVKESTLLGKIGYKQGDYKTAAELTYSRAELESYYKEIGYPDVKVNIKITQDDEKTYNDVEYIITEGDEKRVSEIAFVNNTKISSRELTKHLSSQKIGLFKSGFLNMDKVSEDIKAIEAYYKNLGYVDAAVVLDGITVLNPESPSPRKNVKVTYKVTEGETWRVGDVITSGNTILPSAELIASTKLKKGNFFNNEIFEEDKNAIMNLYYTQGYIFAMLNAVTKRNANNTIDIDYQLVEGSKAYIEHVKFTGLVKTKDYVFRRELAIKDGEAFNREKLQQSYQNIYNTGLVSELNYSLTRGSDDEHLIMNFDIKEAQSMDMTFGVTFGGNDTGFPLSFVTSFNNKNLSGTGKTLTVGGQVTTDYQAVNFSFGSNWFGDKRWANSFSFSFERSEKDNILQKNPDSEYQVGRNEAFPYGYSSYDDYEAYDEAIPHIKYLMSYEMYRFAFGYNTGYTWIFNNVGRMSVSFGLSLGLNHVNYDKEQYVPFEYLIYQYSEGWRFSNRASLSLTWDGRDYIDNTTKGYMLSQSFIYAGGILQGLSNYIKSISTFSGYVSLFKLKDVDVRPRALVASYTTSVSLVLPQLWNAGKIDTTKSGWGWHDAKFGATRSEMLYIDGMRYARGHSTVYDISFMWDNMFELSFPLVKGVVNAEAFSSITAVSKQLENLSSSIIWYGAFGIGAKLKVSGFPLGIYFAADYKVKDGQISWIEGGLFNYIHPVIAISTSLI